MRGNRTRKILKEFNNQARPVLANERHAGALLIDHVTEHFPAAFRLE